MRLAFSLCTAVMLAAALPLGALADGAPVTAESLAEMQSLTDHCGRLNPDAATQFEVYSAQFVKNIPQPQVVQLRGSAAYKSAYAKATAELATRPPADVANVCESLLVIAADLRASEPKPAATTPAAPVPEG
jgi:hypothetical protein